MPFEVTARTLDRLEWPEIMQRLARHARTARGRERCAPDAEPPFETNLERVRSLLGETREARSILDEGDVPPLGGLRDLSPLLRRLDKGGTLTGSELSDVASSLSATAATERFLRSRADSAGGLAGLAALLVTHAALEAEIERSIDAEGEVRDGASRELADARREAHQLSGEAQRRVEKMLGSRDLAGALQDAYFTVRGDRYVLPVRADARGRVPGIVHDASSSGTTLFIEPQAVVEVNNRLKQAELRVDRETRRVLAALSARAADAAPEIEANLEVLEQLDLAFARGALAIEMEAVEPVLDETGRYHLDLLRHPLLDPAEAVPNDLRLGEGFHVLVISGPNAGGKTVAMKAVALAVLMTRAGLHVPAAPGARVAAANRVLADIGDEQDMRASLSTFSAHMRNLAEIVQVADGSSLVVLDEIGVGTDPGEGAAIAQSVLEALADAGARVVTTTHYNLLKEMADVDERFANASVEFDGETLAPTYRLQLGTPGSSSATAVAARMGMAATVLDRAAALLEREDRQLDRMLTELSTSRAALERERREAEGLRAEGEAARAEYRTKLERLNERRDKLFEEMRHDLDRAFRDAHAEVAGVIRTLQKGGRAQDAAHARERLLGLEARAEQVAERSRKQTPEAPRARMDWQRAKAGDAVRLPTGQEATLVALPDRRGRATVQAGAARMQIVAEQLAPAVVAPEPSRPRAHVAVETAPPETATGRVDLRGLRVDEALDRVLEALDDAAGAGRGRVEIIHGLGTGRLRKAVRRFLRESPYVARAEDAAREEGGDGVTIAVLR